MSLPPPTDSFPLSIETVGARAARLAGEPVRVAEMASGGGNSRVYRVAGRRASFAAKVYPRHEAEPRDRLATKFAALGYLWENGIDCVPRPIACDREADIALYEWIDGVAIDEPEAGDIDRATHLIERIVELGRATERRRFDLASAACLSGAALVRQMETRRDRLLDVAAHEPELGRFLEVDFAPVAERMVGRARSANIGEPGCFSRDLDPEDWMLSPSDFGFHNALRRPDGDLVFVDFEYFGWDDPAKLVADFLWHPGMDLSVPLRARFYAAVQAAIVSNGDGHFDRRLRALHPLFGLCWSLILLNEFLPDGWSRRSSGRTVDHAAAKERQLRRAEKLLWNVSTYDDQRPVYN